MATRTDPDRHYQRLGELEAAYRGLCVTCGARLCGCGDGKIGVTGGASTTHYGYHLEQDGDAIVYREVTEELADVRRVFRAYAELGSALRVSQRLASRGYRAYGREWVLRILRCPLHLSSGNVDEPTYRQAIANLKRRRT